MNYQSILVADSDAVRTITLNRPQRRNALTPAMQDELIAAFEDAAVSDCRVVVLAGAGEAFCAGLDLAELQSLETKSAAEHRLDAARIARLLRTLYELPKPTIAAVHGAAIAGGTGLATVCDFTLALADAKFGYTEVRIGFVPAVVSAFLTLQIGDKRSRDLLLTGRLFDGNEAYRLGLINEVVPQTDLATRVLALSKVLIANSPASLSATKRLMLAQNRFWLDAALSAAMEANAEARETPDLKEGVSSFLEKRRPVWAKPL